MQNFEYILLMKAGPYCGYSLDEIIEIKQKEQQECGKFFWGYGGVFCRPHAVNAFVSYAQKHKCRVKLLFMETTSSFKTDSQGRFTFFSKNNAVWKPLDGRVLLVGNVSVPHFAITGANLCKTDLAIDLSDYYSFTGMGMFPERNKRLADYFRYRVDKACGVYSPKAHGIGKMLQISHTADLVDPYCVYIR